MLSGDNMLSELISYCYLITCYQILFIENVTQSTFVQIYYAAPEFSLKGQSHEKVGEMSVWGISLGPN
jgi:hypothetical protein